MSISSDPPEVMSRVATAPISWGVCEVPNWGYQLSPERVLTEMAELGIAATEFGPVGFLPSEPRTLTAQLSQHGLAAVGGFIPVPLHRADFDPTPTVDEAMEKITGSGADSLILAADTGQEGYNERVELSSDEWQRLCEHLDLLAERCARQGVQASLHPHVGTVVERRSDVDHVLEGSNIPLCMDTGHLLVGGTSPEELTEQAVDRIKHVHLKDVDAQLATRVRDGKVEYSAAVAQGLFRPLGDGDIDLARIITALSRVGYDGWYVLEQDVMLDSEPPPGAGPIEDVRRSLDYLRGMTH